MIHDKERKDDDRQDGNRDQNTEHRRDHSKDHGDSKGSVPTHSGGPRKPEREDN